MRRVLGLALLLIMVAGCVPGGGQLGASTSGTMNLVPDPNYTPREGDHVSLYGTVDGSPVEQIPVLSDLTAYDKFSRFAQDGDTVELSNMEQQGWLQYAPLATSVVVMKISDRRHTGAPAGAEVKVLDGNLKGRVVWVGAGNIARLKRPAPAE